MVNYTIYFRFRDKDYQGYVSKYEGDFETYYLVDFRHEDILQDFGGCIKFDAQLNAIPQRPPKADDVIDFHSAVKKQLR